MCRGAGGAAAAGGSLPALSSPPVACGLVLVCANSCYSVGSCRSSDIRAADEPVKVSLFDCLSSWNRSRPGSVLKNSKQKNRAFHLGLSYEHRFKGKSRAAAEECRHPVGGELSAAESGLQSVTKALLDRASSLPRALRWERVCTGQNN